MFKRNTLGGLLAVVVLSVSLTSCAGSGAGATAVVPQTATPTAKDGTKAFIEAARDRVPMINSSTDEEIAVIGKNICAPSGSMSAANAEEMTKSMLVLADQARNDAEAAVIVGLAKQHMCRPV